MNALSFNGLRGLVPKRRGYACSRSPVYMYNGQNSIMNRILAIVCLCCGFACALMANDKPAVTCFAVITASSEDVILGDSALVTYTIYASSPIHSAKTLKAAQTKNAQLRELPIRRNGTLGRVVRDGKLYYTLVWSQAVLTTRKLGVATIKPAEIEVRFVFRKSSGDVLRDYFNGTETFEVKVKAIGQPLKIMVKEKPRRTTVEMIHEGII